MAETGSEVETSERDLHGATSAGQRYCFWIELAAPDFHEDSAFQVLGAGRLTECRDILSSVSWLDFVLYAPVADKTS
jgi:hypothetical protein